MKTAKRIIFISLLILLFAGAVLLNPLIRFTWNLRQERFRDAESIYLDCLSVSDTLRSESAEKLKRYLEKQLARYFAKKLRYDRIMGILSNLSETCLPQQDVACCRKAAEEMEQARQRQIEKEKQQREKTIQDNLRNAQLSPPPTSELSNFAEALKYLEPVEHYK